MFKRKDPLRVHAQSLPSSHERHRVQRNRGVRSSVEGAITRNLLGMKQDEFVGKYNSHLTNLDVVLVEELDNLRKHTNKRVYDTFKQLVTGDFVKQRKMHTDYENVRNYALWMLTSNNGYLLARAVPFFKYEATENMVLWASINCFSYGPVEQDRLDNIMILFRAVLNRSDGERALREGLLRAKERRYGSGIPRTVWSTLSEQLEIDII